MENLTVKIEGNNGTLTVLEGKALTPRENKKVIINGNIKAPNDYARVKNPTVSDSLVVFSKTDLKISYYANQTDELAAEVHGTLKLNPIIGALGINTGGKTRYSTNELGDVIKRYRSLFDDISKADPIVTALKNFKAKVTQKLETSNNNKGNVRALIEQEVVSNMPTTFKVKMPIFEGFEDNVFEVEICFDVFDSEVKVYLESPQLNDVMLTDSGKLIDENLAYFKEKRIAIVEGSITK